MSVVVMELQAQLLPSACTACGREKCLVFHPGNVGSLTLSLLGEPASHLLLQLLLLLVGLFELSLEVIHLSQVPRGLEKGVKALGCRDLCKQMPSPQPTRRIRRLQRSGCTGGSGGGPQDGLHSCGTCATAALCFFISSFMSS